MKRGRGVGRGRERRRRGERREGGWYGDGLGKERVWILGKKILKREREGYG